MTVRPWVMATGTLLLFLWELAESGSLGRAQTTALTTTVLFQVFHVGKRLHRG